MQYFDLMQMDPLEHFVYFVTGKAQEWATDKFNMHKSGVKPLTRESLRTEFLLSYGDAQRNTGMAARDRLHAQEHSMQSDESVPQYTQRFHEIIREAKDMSTSDKISWYIKGLVPALRGRCATDDEGKDWQDLDKLTLYAVGQEVRWKAAKEKAQLAAFNAQHTTPKAQNSSKTKRPPSNPAPQKQGDKSQGGMASFKKPRTDGKGDSKLAPNQCRICRAFKKPSETWSDHKAECIKNQRSALDKKMAHLARLENQMEE
ncbi:hypothetical protein PLESTB_001314300 [Pleodorina starrii]|uniref:Retrotransposon gag domain-containing protein n=1 Tax=Pleodorina starrii TaxID=330485 RepID=A0A9W6F6A2_9CHLO|nr:hypothetical protein PLESTB_001314200 [Pleodorina starrii]GLC58063.1 hypothetical protein PLESTB_001314300 [Pleodorina starrii]